MPSFHLLDTRRVQYERHLWSVDYDGVQEYAARCVPDDDETQSKLLEDLLEEKYVEDDDVDPCTMTYRTKGSSSRQQNAATGGSGGKWSRSSAEKWSKKTRGGRMFFSKAAG